METAEDSNVVERAATDGGPNAPYDQSRAHRARR
jgi:hypothetical protein